ncbi:MAG: hypothetical protein IJ705_03700, partial [Oscillospiraceae bacterium]|nr:hypothetical protein [Oscillospiraceae bacterium]
TAENFAVLHGVFLAQGEDTATAVVSAAEDSRVLVALYDARNGAMVCAGSAEVPGGVRRQDIPVRLPQARRENMLVKAFLVDAGGLRPLAPAAVESGRLRRFPPEAWSGTYDWLGIARFRRESGLLVIENPEPNAAEYLLEVPVLPHTDYRLRARVRVEGYSRGNDLPGGATVGVSGKVFLNDYVRTPAWTESEIVFHSGNDSTVTLRLSYGGYAASSRGTAYFDAVTLEELGGQAEPGGAGDWQTVVKQGQYLLAVNTVTLTGSGEPDGPEPAEGRFTLTRAEDAGAAEAVPLRSVEAESRTPPVPLLPLSLEGGALLPLSPGRDRYAAGDRRTVGDADGEQKYGDPNMEMECVVIGKYCTVWMQAGSPEQFRLTPELANALAEDYDAAMAVLLPVYGGWLDVDGDGRVALLCRGTDERPNLLGGGYTDARNLYDRNGSILLDGFRYTLYSVSEESAPHFMGMDCVHVGTEGLNRQRLLYVALHETVHLISYSYCLAHDGNAAGSGHFLTEALAEAGPSLLEEQLHYLRDVSVDWFGRETHDTGRGLLASQETDNVYGDRNLFLQYLRTRYARMTGDQSGNAFLSLLLRAQLKTEGALLRVVAEEIFGVPPQRLIEDFWAAMFLREPEGIYGFQGEEWAGGIRCRLSSPEDTGGIFNGGAKYYYMADGDYIVSSAENLSFLVLEPGEAAAASLLSAGADAAPRPEQTLLPW